MPIQPDAETTAVPQVKLAPDATTLAKVARMRERLKPASRRVSLNAQP